MRKRRMLPLEELAPFLVEPPAPLHRGDGQALFGNDHPLELEIGFGKGDFLLAQAAASPHHNFLGIETDRARQLHTATRLARRRLTNVRLFRAPALAFLRDHIPAHQFRAIHVYFPDPWWKNRHRKRRLFTPAFVGECDRVLAPGGNLILATDVEDYFVRIMKCISDHTRLRPAASEATDTPQPLGSGFERKALLKQRPIWRARFVKDGR